MAQYRANEARSPRSLLFAFVNLLHPRMLWLMIWPMLIALCVWGMAALLSLGAQPALLARRAAAAAGSRAGAFFVAWDCGDATLIAAHVLLVLLFVPLV